LTPNAPPAALAALALALAGAAAAAALAPLGYELPAAGSYELPVIQRVSDHALLASDGAETRLLPAGGTRLAVIAFVYLHCTDAAGCPLALAELQRADRALAERPELRSRVQLLTVSFDPARDRPDAMADLRSRLAPRSDWRFLTARDAARLAPVLRDFGQDAVPELTAEGMDSGVVRHVVKVFLVDPQGGVRNIYSTGFLDHRLLLRDVETLLLSE
jgi:cytochrome oxidase Cu insertion factor (SCO1/SenC/PrrC family)